MKYPDHYIRKGRQVLLDCHALDKYFAGSVFISVRCPMVVFESHQMMLETNFQKDPCNSRDAFLCHPICQEYHLQRRNESNAYSASLVQRGLLIYHYYFIWI